MQRSNEDPKDQAHELKRPTRERGGPRTDAEGQEDRAERSENSALEVNRRENMDEAAPSEVRRTEREHDAPTAPEADEGAAGV